MGFQVAKNLGKWKWMPSGAVRAATCSWPRVHECIITTLPYCAAIVMWSLIVRCDWFRDNSQYKVFTHNTCFEVALSSFEKDRINTSIAAAAFVQSFSLVICGKLPWDCWRSQNHGVRIGAGKVFQPRSGVLASFLGILHFANYIVLLTGSPPMRRLSGASSFFLLGIFQALRSVCHSVAWASAAVA